MTPSALIVSAGLVGGSGRAADQIAWRLADRGLTARRIDLAGRRAAGRLMTGAARRVREAVGPQTIAVIATHPEASRLLGRLRQAGKLPAPVITYLTEMAVHPAWIAPGVDHHLAIHPLAAAQAAAYGARDVSVAGPAIAPAFAPAGPDRRWLARRRFGLPDDERIALVVTGAHGTGDFENTARDILATGLALPVIACGTNTAARERLNRTRQCLALGWVDDMPSLLHSADLVVQSAGGMTGLEALACRVPVISYRGWGGYAQLSAAALDEAGWVPWARDQTDLDYLLRCPLTAPVIDSGEDVASAVLALTRLIVKAAA